MPCDCHVHVSSTRGGSVDERARNLVDLLRAYGLDSAIVLPLDGLFSNCCDHCADNDFVFHFCQRSPEHLIPSFSVNPLFGMKALDEIKRCREKLGLTVLKLHPWLQGFSLCSEPMDAVARLCQELGVTIVFHDGTPPYCAPLQLARLCRDYPALRVVSGHAGLNDLWSDAIAAARRYPNYYVCLCGVSLHPIERIVAEVPANQVCVGSDWIDNTEDVMWYRWNIWRRARVSPERREVIENVTPRRLLGLTA